MTSLAQNEDRRRQPRHPVEKNGKLFCDNFSVIFDCHIGNESVKGMSILLDLDPAIPLPKDISLLDKKTNKIIDARVAWRDGNKAGIQFVGKKVDVDRLPGAGIKRVSILATHR